MSDKPVFFVQAFAMKRGRLVPGEKAVAPTGAGALKRAEALATRSPGAAAVSIVADPETGEVQKAEILGTFGQVPEDFAESLTAA